MVSHSNYQGEKGGIMILFAFLLVSLFALVALTVDTTLITSSQSHFKTSTDAAVLGALEVYGDELSKGANPTLALNRAIAKAETYLGQNFANNPGKFLQKVAANTQSTLGTDCSVTAPGNGCLRPIDWYPPVPTGGVCTFPSPYSATDPNWRPCPCNQSCECGEGCAGDPFAATPPREGAGLKLRFRTDRNSPLTALFGTVIGFINGSGTRPEVGINIESTALLTPRNAVFLLDLSSSMVALARPGAFPTGFYDTNPAALADPESQICYKRFYNYPIWPANTCSASNIYGPSPLNPLTNSVNREPKNNYYNCEVNPTYLGGSASQYTCFSGATSIPVEFNGLTPPYPRHNFLINTTVDPEPLTSALDAVNQAMNSFVGRKVPKDRLGLIGFDDTRINNRILAEDNTAPMTSIRPALLNSPQFADFEIATRVSGTLKTPMTDSRRYGKFLFPRYFSDLGEPNKVASDLPETFKMARNMIINTQNFRAAQNFVVIFSDGMTNCLSPLAPAPRCKSDPATFNQSLGLLQTELAAYATNRIAVHFLLLGAKSAPHRLAWQNKSGTGCATADEIPDLVVSGQNVPTLNAEGPFNANGSPLVNQIYPWVKATGGIWAPIMDSYGVNPTGSCPNINQAAFDAACRTLNDPVNLASLTGTGATFPNGVSIGGAAVWSPASQYWDTSGRILCDPQNRTTSQQVNDIMKTILSKPPFVLVRQN